MKNELTHTQVIEMLPAYALGALEPDEMLAVDAYLAQHPDLTERLAEIEETLVSLAGLVPQTPLLEDGKTRLMARVRADLAERATVQPQTGRPTTDSDNNNWWSRLRATLGSNGWRLAAGGAVVALLLLLLYTVQLSSSISDLQGQLATLQAGSRARDMTIRQLEAEKVQAQQDIATLQAEVTALTEDYNQLLAQRDALENDFAALQAKAEALEEAQNRLAFVAAAPNIVAVPGTDVAPTASATFYSDDESQAGLLVLRDLEPLLQAETYQLWLIPPDGTPVSAGLVGIEAGRPTWNDVQIPPTGQDFVVVGVSREPAGGSPTPTTIVLLGNVG